MKPIARLLLRPMLCLLLMATLSACGGYANAPGDGSGVQVYGTVDAGVVHQSR